jgi:hypothetical protein
MFSVHCFFLCLGICPMLWNQIYGWCFACSDGSASLTVCCNIYHENCFSKLWTFGNINILSLSGAKTVVSCLINITNVIWSGSYNTLINFVLILIYAPCFRRRGRYILPWPWEHVSVHISTNILLHALDITVVWLQPPPPSGWLHDSWPSNQL